MNFDTGEFTSFAERRPLQDRETGFVDNVRAKFENFQAIDRSISEFVELERQYDVFLDQVNRATGEQFQNPEKLHPNMLGEGEKISANPLDNTRRARERLHGRLTKMVEDGLLSPELNRSEEQVRAEMAERLREIEKRTQQVTMRASKLGVAGQMVGTVGAAFTDPPVLITSLVGMPWASRVVIGALGDAAIAGAVETAIQAKVQPFRREVGLPAGFEQGLENVLGVAGGTAAFSLLLRGGVKGLQHLVERAERIDRGARTQELEDSLALVKRTIEMLEDAPAALRARAVAEIEKTTGRSVDLEGFADAHAVNHDAAVERARAGEVLQETDIQPMQRSVPTFEDFRQVLPTDAEGLADVSGSGAAIIREIGGEQALWKDLTPEQRQAAFDRARGQTGEVVEDVRPPTTPPSLRDDPIPVSPAAKSVIDDLDDPARIVSSIDDHPMIEARQLQVDEAKRLVDQQSAAGNDDAGRLAQERLADASDQLESDRRALESGPVQPKTDAVATSELQAAVTVAENVEAPMHFTNDIKHPRNGLGIVDAINRAKTIPQTIDIDTPARTRLRIEIADTLYQRGLDERKYNRIAHVLLGPSGAGKSFMANPIIKREGALLIDSDEAKKLIPEYEDGIGTAAVHEESDFIVTELMFTRVLLDGDNIVWPLTGKTVPNVADRLELLAQEGFTINLHLFDVSTETSVNRVVNRFAKAGRLIDPRYAASLGRKPLNTFNEVIKKDYINAWTHFTNEVPKGSPPRLIAESEPGIARRLLGLEGEPGVRPERGQAGGRGEGQAQGIRTFDPVTGIEDGPPITIRRFDPANIFVDAERFQFKAGGDDKGVTERLAGLGKFDEMKAGIVLVWEDKAGKRFIVDGHQRLALAMRAITSGQKNVFLNGFLLREVDGISAAEARATAAIKNIAEGTGTAKDAAKVLRDLGSDADLNLPPRSPLVRDAQALKNLSPDAFDMVINDVVPENYAAHVGRLIKDGDQQVAALSALAKAEPPNTVQAALIVEQIRDAGFTRTETSDLFGGRSFAETLFKERAAILDGALKQAKRDRTVFNTLVREERTIATGGNRLDTAANIERVQNDQTLIATLSRLANRKGPVSEALSAAAEAIKQGKAKSRAVEDFLGVVKERVEAGDLDGVAPRGRGPGLEDSAATSLRTEAENDLLRTERQNLDATAGDLATLRTDRTAAGLRRGAETLITKDGEEAVTVLKAPKAIEQVADADSPQRLRAEIETHRAEVERLLADDPDFEVTLDLAVDGRSGQTVSVTRKLRDILADLDDDDKFIEIFKGCVG